MSGFFTSPRIAWGPGAIEQLSGLGAHHALVVIDPAIAGADGPRRAVEELAKSDTTVEIVNDLAEPDHLPTVARLARRTREVGADWLVAIGGGRTIDGAKAARILSERSEVAEDAVPPLLEVADPPRTRLAAIPTTSGSGADASWTADLWTAQGGPVELAHRAVAPDWSLVDPRFAHGLAHDVRLDGAMEALGGAAEAYLSAWANPFSDSLALETAATVLERLPHALRWSDDPDASAAIHYSATRAGLAASNSQRGLAHALARALQPTTGRPYGRLLGIVLPAVLDFDQPSARDRIERLTSVSAADDETPRVAFATRLRRVADLFRFPPTLRAAGVAADAIARDRDAIVERTLRSPAALANPRVPSPAEVGTLLDGILGS